MKRIIYPLLAVLLTAGACTPDVEPLAFTAPLAEFPQSADKLSVSVGEPYVFEARILEGDGLTMGWYIDDVLESSNGTLEYTWHEPGEYEVRFTASNGAGTVEKIYTVNVSDRLKIFISSSDTYEVGQNQSVEFLEQSYLELYAVVEEGSNVRHQWIVDGDVQDCEDAYFHSYWLPAGKAEHSVSYKGANAVGTYECDFTVNVVERPLTVSFSNEASAIACLMGASVEIDAIVEFGGTGVEHSWTLDGQKVSEDSHFAYTFNDAGIFTVDYAGRNAKGETVEHSWTVSVSSREEVLLDDYESGDKGVFVQQNGGKLSVVDNPFPDEHNGSAKVLSVTGSSSGYFGFVYDAVAALGIDVSQYDGIKVDVYIQDTRFYPCMEYNKVKYWANEDTPYEYNKWISLDYDLKFSSKSQLQPRPFVDRSGNSKGSNSVVYYDNIYLYKK